MSGLVRQRYCNAPITLLFFVLSAGAEPSVKTSGVLVDIGVRMSLAISMEVLESKSRMYLCCERKRPLAVGITSMPRKKNGDVPCL